MRCFLVEYRDHLKAECLLPQQQTWLSLRLECKQTWLRLWFSCVSLLNTLWIIESDVGAQKIINKQRQNMTPARAGRPKQKAAGVLGTID